MNSAHIFNWSGSMPHGFCHCGCGGKAPIAKSSVFKRGEVRGEPKRFINHHHKRSRKEPWTFDPKTGCWNWNRSKTSAGYGFIMLDGERAYAHRESYKFKFGNIPNGLIIDHLCRNRGCVNPDHLQAVTNAENCRRGVSTKLKKVNVLKIRKLYASGTGPTELAAMFGVTRDHISGIVANQSWVSDMPIVVHSAEELHEVL